MRVALYRNPVFEHEFVRFCRTRKWFVVRTILASTLTVALWLFLIQGRADIDAGNLDAVGRSLFAAACFVQILFLLFATPGLTADLIASEKRSGNLEVLLSTPLPRTGIVYGKVFSRVSLLLVVTASAFPAISVTLLFGGVRIEQVAGLFLVSAGLVLGLSGPSILLSSLADRAGLSAVLAYLFAALPGLVLLIPTVEAHPILGAGYRLALPGGYVDSEIGFLYSGSMVLLAGVFLFCSGTFLALLRLRALRFGGAVRSPGPGAWRIARSRAGWDRGNPIATWESRRVRGHSLFGPFWTMLALLLAAELVVWLVAPIHRAMGSSSADPTFLTAAHAAILTGEAFVILLFAALAGSTTVIADREQGRIELFRLTRLTPREVVQGKAFGTARAVLPLALVPTIHLFLAGPFEPRLFLFGGAFLLILVVSTGICAADGVLNSIQGATVQSAVLRSIWHFCWLTLFIPLVQVLLPLVFAGAYEPLTGPQFSLLYPLHHSASLALGAEGTTLHVFGFVFWLVLLALMAAGLFLLLGRGGFGFPGSSRHSGEPSFGDWRESWERLASQWDEEP